jgi:hypothetical protein
LGQEAAFAGSTGNRRKLLSAAKPFNIPKKLVYEAFKAVKANFVHWQRGMVGVFS